MAEARAQLLALQGPTTPAAARLPLSLCKTTKCDWVHVETVDVTMRDYSAAFVGRYLSAAGERALGSVGCYQIEGLGVQLDRKCQRRLLHGAWSAAAATARRIAALASSRYVSTAIALFGEAEPSVRLQGPSVGLCCA